MGWKMGGVGWGMHHPAKCLGGIGPIMGTKSSVLLVTLDPGSSQYHTVDSMPTSLLVPEIIGQSLLHHHL